jgi:hypothetical protein
MRRPRSSLVRSAIVPTIPDFRRRATARARRTLHGLRVALERFGRDQAVFPQPLAETRDVVLVDDGPEHPVVHLFRDVELDGVRSDVDDGPKIAHHAIPRSSSSPDVVDVGIVLARKFPDGLQASSGSSCSTHSVRSATPSNSVSAISQIAR